MRGSPWEPPIIGSAGADISCAVTTGADRAQVTIAAASIEVFIVIFPLIDVSIKYDTFKLVSSIPAAEQMAQ
jgi:hypothetical protein